MIYPVLWVSHPPRPTFKRIRRGSLVDMPDDSYVNGRVRQNVETRSERGLVRHAVTVWLEGFRHETLREETSVNELYTPGRSCDPDGVVGLETLTLYLREEVGLPGEKSGSWLRTRSTKGHKCVRADQVFREERKVSHFRQKRFWEV